MKEKKGKREEKRRNRVPNSPVQKCNLCLRAKKTTTRKNPFSFDVQNP